MPRPKKSDKDDVGRLAFGVVLLLLWLFLSASVLSYTPWDLPTKFVFHEHDGVGNIAGLVGAWCASLCTLFFGAGGYFLVLASGIGVLFYWLNKLDEVWLKTLGGFIMLVAASGFSAYVVKGSTGSPVGPGGCVGASLKFLLDQVFVPIGAYFALAGLFFAGLILVTPLRTLSFLFWSTGLARAVVWIVAPFWRRIYAAKPAEYKIDPVFTPNATPARPALSARRARPVVAQNGEMAQSRPLSYVNGRPIAVSAPQVERYAGLSVATPTVLSPDDDRVAEFDPDDFAPLAPPNRPLFSQPLKEQLDAAARNDAAPNATHYAPTAYDDPTEEPEIQRSGESTVRSDQRSTTSPVDLYALNEREDDYVLPSIELLEPADEFDYEAFHEQIVTRGAELERACMTFGVELKVVDIQMGPVLTQYEVELKEGLRVKKLHNLEKDLEIALKAEHVRIVSPIPGKNTVGVEIPNKTRQAVRLREVLESCAEQAQKMALPVFLGKDVVGAPMVADLAKLPHLLIAGRTGTGKSVCLNSIIMSLLMTRSPKQCKLIMIDPKMVELSPYKTIPHLMHPVVVDMEKAEAILEWATEKMEARYKIFSKVGARQLSDFNKMPLEVMRKRLAPKSDEEWLNFPKSMPSIVIIADEMADLIMTSGKEVEKHIVRLAQKSRAVGIHLVLATQKPTVDVVTGLIKSNLPARISFAVATRTDSLVVLDDKGAEQLLGNGDMLFLQPGTSQTVRGQGAYVSDKEIDTVIETISVEEPEFEIEIKTKSETESDEGESSVDVDPLYVSAVDFVIGEGRASTSLLQRKFSIGYSRASRIVDMMAEDGIVSRFNPAKPSSPRSILVTMEQWRGKQSKAEEQKNAQKAPSLASQRVDSTNDYVSTAEGLRGSGPVYSDAPLPFVSPPVPQIDGDMGRAAYVPTSTTSGPKYSSPPKRVDLNALASEESGYRESSYETSHIATKEEKENAKNVGAGSYSELSISPPSSSLAPQDVDDEEFENQLDEQAFEEFANDENASSVANSANANVGWDDEQWNKYLDVDEI